MERIWRDREIRKEYRERIHKEIYNIDTENTETHKHSLTIDTHTQRIHRERIHTPLNNRHTHRASSTANEERQHSYSHLFVNQYHHRRIATRPARSSLSTGIVWVVAWIVRVVAGTRVLVPSWVLGDLARLRHRRWLLLRRSRRRVLLVHVGRARHVGSRWRHLCKGDMALSWVMVTIMGWGWLTVGVRWVRHVHWWLLLVLRLLLVLWLVLRLVLRGRGCMRWHMDQCVNRSIYVYVRLCLRHRCGPCVSRSNTCDSDHLSAHGPSRRYIFVERQRHWPSIHALPANPIQHS